MKWFIKAQYAAYSYALTRHSWRSLRSIGRANSGAPHSSTLAHHTERSPNNLRDLTANPQGSIRLEQIREYHLADIPESDRFSQVWRNARP